MIVAGKGAQRPVKDYMLTRYACYLVAQNGDPKEGNTRARGLYEKMGFRITGVKPDAIRLKNGTLVNEYMMLKRL